MSDTQEKLLPAVPEKELKKPSHSLQKLSKQYTEDALQKLVTLMQYAEDEHVQLQAANAILDRGWGKASVKIEVENDDKLDLPKMQEALLQTKAYVDSKIQQAMQVENERQARYIVDVEEVSSDSSARSTAVLQDNGEGGGDNSAGLHSYPVPDPVPDPNAPGAPGDGSHSNCEAAPDYGNNAFKCTDIQSKLRYSRPEDAALNT